MPKLNNNSLNRLETIHHHQIYYLVNIKQLDMEEKATSRKKIAQIKQGRVISTWDGIREMCKVLGLDRRAVIRNLKQEPHYNSVKGFQFKYVD